MHVVYTPPELLSFSDDGTFPNSPYPVLLYRRLVGTQGDEAAAWLEQRFAGNRWTNSWRNGIYSYHHYHSNTHEVLGIYQGSALLQLGGPSGLPAEVHAGDVLILPAGTGHKCLRHSDDFAVAGAYPDGIEPDINKGRPGERPAADERIAALPMPPADPVWGTAYGLLQFWKQFASS